MFQNLTGVFPFPTEQPKLLRTAPTASHSLADASTAPCFENTQELIYGGDRAMMTQSSQCHWKFYCSQFPKDGEHGPGLFLWFLWEGMGKAKQGTLSECRARWSE